jgi:FlaG/FlaF family flagellin (archaellin)
VKQGLVRVTLVLAATFATTTLGQQTVTRAGGSERPAYFLRQQHGSQFELVERPHIP